MESREFVSAERCDRCSAPALREAYKDDVGALLFCNHHYKQHEAALISTGWNVVTDGTLVEPVPVAAFTE